MIMLYLKSTGHVSLYGNYLKTVNVINVTGTFVNKLEEILYPESIK